MMKRGAMSEHRWWRFVGSLANAFDVELLRSQSLDGWNPNEICGAPLAAHPIVLPDPRRPKRWLFARLWGAPLPAPSLYAVIHGTDERHFYVPAQGDEPDTVKARAACFEGHWSATRGQGDLPWPEPSRGWGDRSRFLRRLAQVEEKAERITYRGLSSCRLCGRLNGDKAFRLDVWEWPAGFRHYVEDHEVAPSADFTDFVQREANES